MIEKHLHLENLYHDFIVEVLDHDIHSIVAGQHEGWSVFFGNFKASDDIRASFKWTVLGQVAVLQESLHDAFH